MKETFFITIIGLMMVSFTQAATLTFLTVHPGTGTYAAETNIVKSSSINQLFSKTNLIYCFLFILLSVT